MSRTIHYLAIAGSVLAALTAIAIRTGAAFPAPVIPALFCIGAGIYLTISKDWRRWAPGAVAILLAILGILGTIRWVSGDSGDIEFPISETMGLALIIIACLEFPTVVVLMKWGDHDPEWMGLVFGGFIVVADLLALIFRESLVDTAAVTTLLVGVLALATLWPTILAMRE